MKYLLIILIPLIAAAKDTKSANGEFLAAGEWHSEAHFKLNGIPMPATEDVNCVTKDESKDPKKAIEESLGRNDCKLLTWSMKKQTVKATVSCETDQYEAHGDIGGTFTSKSYDLTGEIKGQHHFLGKATATVQLSGKWQRTCKEK